MKLSLPCIVLGGKKIPLTAEEFSQVLPGSSFDQHHIFTVSIDDATAVVKFSNLMPEYPNIQEH